MNNQVEQVVTHAKPRIYVRSLADYVAGNLLGRWIDADQPAEAIHAEIAELLANSSEEIAEEWAIHDYENFEGLSLDEYSDIASVAHAAALIVEHGPVFAGLASHFGGLCGVGDAKRYMEEGYQGEFDSVEDYACQFVEDCYSDVLKQIPDFIRYHIDYEGIARDLEMGGDILVIHCNRKAHIFFGNV